MSQPRISKPQRRLPAQYTDFSVAECGTGSGTGAALPRDYQDDASALAMRALEEIVNSLMRIGDTSSMEINPRIDLQMSLGQISTLPSVDGPERPNGGLHSGGRLH